MEKSYVFVGIKGRGIYRFLLNGEYLVRPKSIEMERVIKFEILDTDYGQIVICLC